MSRNKLKCPQQKIWYPIIGLRSLKTLMIKVIVFSKLSFFFSKLFDSRPSFCKIQLSNLCHFYSNHRWQASRHTFLIYAFRPIFGCFQLIKKVTTHSRNLKHWNNRESLKSSLIHFPCVLDKRNKKIMKKIEIPR